MATLRQKIADLELQAASKRELAASYRRGRWTSTKYDTIGVLEHEAQVCEREAERLRGYIERAIASSAKPARSTPAKAA